MTRESVARWRWLWLPLAFFLTCAGWAITSPVGSAPDDDYHLSSIWCAAGECRIDPQSPDSRLVPRNVAQAADCYRYEASIPASCAADVAADTTPVPVTHVNDVEHLYPTGFYSAMSVMVGDDVERSILMMRLGNAALVSLLLVLLLRTAPAGISFASTAALVVTFIPLGLSILGSTNPSGWASAGVLFFWGFSLALIRRRDWRIRRTWLLAGGAVVSAGLAMAARIDASVYLLLAALLVLVLAGWRRMRRNRWSALLVASLGVLGAFNYLTVGSPASGGGEATMGEASRGLDLLLTNATYFPTLVQGIVGGWPLGWNDTVMPPVVPIVGVLALGGLTWAGLGRMWPRKAWAVSIAAVALVAIPLFFLQKEGLGVGEMVQPRYLLALLSLLVATLLVDRPLDRALPLPVLPVRVLAVGLTLSAVVAFWANAHRYAFGSSVGLFDLRAHPAWVGSPELPYALVVFLIGLTTTAVVAGALLLGSQPLEPRDDIGEHPHEGNAGRAEWRDLQGR